MKQLALLAAFLALPMLGCGAAEQRTAHTVLNGITDVADPTYALAVDSCDAARDVIIARTGTTYAEDRSAMDSIHEICDPMVAGFEGLRAAQITARAAIDGGLTGTTLEAIRQALGLWDTLRALVPQLATLGQTEGS